VAKGWGLGEMIGWAKKYQWAFEPGRAGVEGQERAGRSFIGVEQGRGGRQETHEGRWRKEYRGGLCRRFAQLMQSWARRRRRGEGGGGGEG